MTISQLCNLIRDQYYLDINDYSNTRLLTYINPLKDRIWSFFITYINEYYNWDTFKANSVVWQSEYIFPQIASNSLWTKKINEVLVNYDNTTYTNWSLQYVKAKKVDLHNLQYEWEYYINNQPKTAPIYYLADNSIFIAPMPDVAITNWIYIKWIKNIKDFTWTETESQIPLPYDIMWLFIDWVWPYILRSQWKRTEAVNLDQIFIQRLKETSLELANRVEAPYEMSYPNDNTNDVLFTINNTI